MTSEPLGVGIVGLGRAFMLTLPALVRHTFIRIAAAMDPRPEARARFETEFGARGYDSLEGLLGDPAVEAVYIASPHQFHADHVCLAATFGKHVLVEKPMALTLDECTRMIEATRQAGVHLIVGHSHSFDAPILRTREMIDSGLYGKVRMITAQNFTDFLYRPRRPEELQTEAGGGVIHSQATHQIDIVRLLGGGVVTSVSAHTGQWDPLRPTEGAYSALLAFEGSAFATATYSGYGHYDSDVWMDNIGELGQSKLGSPYAASRKRLDNLASAAGEAELKAARNYGGSLYTPGPEFAKNLAHQHFGPLIISCDKADLRPGPNGVEIYTDTEKIVESLPAPKVPRIEVMDELIGAVMHDRAPLHSGEWARATASVCLAILQSARTASPCQPACQVAYAARP